MRGNQHPRGEVAAREARAWTMAVEGYTHEEIAEELRVTRQGVGRMLGRVSRRKRDELTKLASVQVAQHHARLMAILREALAAWERSKRPRIARRRRTVGAAKGQRLIEITRTETNAGPQARYLFLALNALRALAILWGFYAPTRIEARVFRPLLHVSDAELRRRLAAPSLGDER